MADAPFGARSRGCFYYSRASGSGWSFRGSSTGRSRVDQIVFMAAQRPFFSFNRIFVIRFPD